jgi:hypothetical protein
LRVIDVASLSNCAEESFTQPTGAASNFSITTLLVTSLLVGLAKQLAAKIVTVERKCGMNMMLMRGAMAYDHDYREQTTNLYGLSKL